MSEVFDVIVNGITYTKIKSPHRVWSVEACPTGLCAVHPDYDGAEDGNLTCVYGHGLGDLMNEVDMWEEENE